MGHSNSKIIVSSDDYFIWGEAIKFNLEIDERPPELADDKATLDEVMVSIAKKYPSFDYYVCLPPTSPLRNHKHVFQALALVSSQENTLIKYSLISVMEERKSIWKLEDKTIKPIIEITKCRQWIDPVYIANGAIFITPKENLLRSEKKVSGRVLPFVMKPEESIDIHTREDIELAEHFMRKEMV